MGESYHQLIEEIIEILPFYDIDHFIRRAIQVYLTWERDPKSTMGLFQTFPFTTEQEQFMHQSMQKQVIKDEFGHVIDVDKHDELVRQQNLREQNNLPELRTGFPHTLSALNDFKPTNIHQLLEEILVHEKETLEMKAGANDQVYEPTIPTINANKQELKQEEVLLN